MVLKVIITFRVKTSDDQKNVYAGQGMTTKSA